MARGFVSGTLWGVIVIGLGLAGLSLIGGSPQDTAPVPAAIPPVAGTEISEPGAATGEESAAEIAEITGAPSGASPQPAQPAPAPGDMPAGGREVGEVAAQTGLDGQVVAPGEESAMAAPQGEPGVSLPGGPLAGPAPAGAEALPETGGRPGLPQVTSDAGQVSPAPGDGQAAAIMPGGDPALAGTPPALAPSVAGAEEQPVAGMAPAAPGRIRSEPVAPIGDLAENVTTGRLPRIGEDTADAGEGDAAAAGDAPAIRRNAAPFDNPETRPMMAVLLVDEAGSRAALGDLKSLPFATSFVVDAAAPDAAEAVAFYRNAGAEVVLSVPVPAGAAPSDVEVTLQVYGGLLDNAVAMLAPKSAGFQTLGAAATQVATVLTASGHGLISLPQGLNTGHKSAVKAGVPAGLVFRELDNDGQSGSVIRRFMDNAAFKARQEKGVILLAHARVETIQALIEWSLGNRAQSVALAPVSAVLQDR